METLHAPCVHSTLPHQHKTGLTSKVTPVPRSFEASAATGTSHRHWRGHTHVLRITRVPDTLRPPKKGLTPMGSRLSLHGGNFLDFPPPRSFLASWSRCVRPREEAGGHGHAVCSASSPFPGELPAARWCARGKDPSRCESAAERRCRPAVAGCVLRVVLIPPQQS